MMRPRGISQKSNMLHFQFSIWLKFSLREVHFAEKPTWIRPVVPKLLKDSQNKRNAFLFLAVSHNQCSWLPTDAARSEHNWLYHFDVGLQSNFVEYSHLFTVSLKEPGPIFNYFFSTLWEFGVNWKPVY